MHTEQRARFEAFAVLQGMHGILQGADENGFYKSNTVNFAHKVWLAAETPLLARIAELEGQLANREPFVVKMPLSISVLISDGLHADFMLNSEIKAAITAAGGRCE